MVDKYFLEIITSYSLSEKQYNDLEGLLKWIDFDWILVKQVPEEVRKDIIVMGEHYVVLSNLTRMDIEPDRFKAEREEHNRRREERRKRKRID